MKSLASNSSSSSSNSHGRGGGSGGASAQLSPTEITAVRQLIAGYRESAAFLLRSADELESLILQQNWAASHLLLFLHLPALPCPHPGTTSRTLRPPLPQHLPPERSPPPQSPLFDVGAEQEKESSATLDPGPSPLALFEGSRIAPSLYKRKGWKRRRGSWEEPTWRRREGAFTLEDTAGLGQGPTLLLPPVSAWPSTVHSASEIKNVPFSSHPNPSRSPSPSPQTPKTKQSVLHFQLNLSLTIDIF